MGIPSTRIYPLTSSFVPFPVPSPPPPPPSHHCSKPHLGELCGGDAAGAAVGIALGGFLFVLLLVLLLWFLCGRVRGPVMLTCAHGSDVLACCGSWVKA